MIGALIDPADEVYHAARHGRVALGFARQGNPHPHALAQKLEDIIDAAQDWVDGWGASWA